jgi:GDSL-like Lipase/Acylhydrolase family
LGWGLLAALLLTTPVPGSRTGWVVALLALAPGTWLLADAGRAARAADVIVTVLSRGAARAALLLVGALVVVAAFIFSISAALVLTVVLASAGLFLAEWAGAPRVERLLAGTVTIGYALLATGLGIEFLAGYVYADRIGAPRELLAWDSRYDSLTKSNLFKFRSPYEQVARRPGVKRIWALGDSFTWGDKIAHTEDTWPAQLERALREAGDVGPVEVVNTGHRGWNLKSKAELLRRFGWQWQPDLVILQYEIGDIEPGELNFRPTIPQPVRLLPTRFRQGAIDRSALLVWAERRVSARLLGSFAPKYRHDGAAWRDVVSALRDIGDSAARHRVPVIVMFYSTLRPEWAAEGSPERAALQDVADVARQSGLDVLDLRPILEAAGDWRQWWATPYDKHPNAAAHHIAALAVAQRIRERGYLGTVGPSDSGERAPGVGIAPAAPR